MISRRSKVLKLIARNRRPVMTALCGGFATELFKRSLAVDSTLSTLASITDEIGRVDHRVLWRTITPAERPCETQAKDDDANDRYGKSSEFHGRTRESPNETELSNR